MKVRDSISEDTKKLFAYLLLTCKNVSLYPEGHSISINSIRQFHETLEAYLRQHGDFRIEIERDQVICQGVEVHKGASEEGTLPFTLFRDGIRWLEFTEGIKLEEMRELLSIIHRYSVLTTEPEGDIVTAFWEANFTHVLYKADDFVSEQASDQIGSVTESQTSRQMDEEVTESEEKHLSPGEVEIETTSPGGIAMDPSDFLLTPEEKAELEEMVYREERSSTSEHLNMLLDMLLQFQEEKDFNIVLGVLSEEFDGAYDRHDFEAALIILDGVQKVLNSGRLRTSWANPLIESFYKDMSSDSKCLKPLENIWSNLNIQQMETLKLIFRHLKPSAVATLVRLLLLGQSSQLEQIAEDTIIFLVQDDVSRLEPLINNSDERIAQKIIPVLTRLEGDTSLKYLMTLARHSSSSIRRMAVKAIGQKCGEQAIVMFNFINDTEEAVRRLVLTHMGQSRNETAEDFLIQYLQSQKFSSAQNDHIIECFRTLGKCGSLRSIPFLRKSLLQRKWMAGFKKSAYRQGAAIALAALNLPEADKIIETAGRSLYPGLRRIARDVGKEISQRNRGGG
jgi:hypothetical protein